jgi:hypothetical protein
MTETKKTGVLIRKPIWVIWILVIGIYLELGI